MVAVLVLNEKGELLQHVFSPSIPEMKIVMNCPGYEDVTISTLHPDYKYLTSGKASEEDLKAYAEGTYQVKSKYVPPDKPEGVQVEPDLTFYDFGRFTLLFVLLSVGIALLAAIFFSVFTWIFEPQATRGITEEHVQGALVTSSLAFLHRILTRKKGLNFFIKCFIIHWR